MMRSLRARLFLGICGVAVLVLGLLSLAIDAAVRRTLQAEFDDVLLEKARTLASMVEQSGPTTHFDYQPEQFPEFNPGPRAAYFEVYLNGKPYQHSASLGEGQLPPAMNRPARRAEPFILPDGRRGRLLVMSFVPLVETDDPAAGPPPNPLPQGVLVVAQDRAALDRTLDRLRLILLGLGAGATLFSGALLVWVAGRAVRPVQRLAQQIESLGPNDLSTVISSDNLPSELAPMVERLNGLLQRLREAFARERAFTADVAHELRTPLAGLRATLEVARSRPRDPPMYEMAIDKSLVILQQQQALVENLLLLARAESGQLAVRSQSVNLPELLMECRAICAESAAQRQLRWEQVEMPFPALATDREILRLVLANLLDNAVSYAPPGSIITVRVGAEGIDAHVVVEVANACTSLTPADLPALLQRFVRKDTSRSATVAHAGLGLSICQRLVTLLQGTIDLRLENGSFIARVRLPAAPSIETARSP